MTDQINTGGAAFPIIGTENTNYVHEGMTLRDYFAAKAMQGLMSAHDNTGIWMATGISDEVAKNSYEVADAMLAARGGAL